MNTPLYWIYVTKKGTKCYLYFDETLSGAILADNELHTELPDFSKTAQADCTGIENCEETNGLYQATDDDGTTYYFRGAVDNNWVQFAGFYWRIIRINGDGSIRLIYSGDSESGPVETGEGTQIGTSAFNEQAHDNAYVGYMYGASGSDTYEETHTNINDSTIKTVIDTWYQTNLISYSNYISTEAGFCGDRQLSTEEESNNGLGGFGTTITYYGANYRLYRNKTPSFECTNTADFYTVANASSGNKALDYPIGLLTIDEASYAGGVNMHDVNNQSYYLYTRKYYWTMSPSSYGGSSRVFYVNENGLLSWSRSTLETAGSVRSVINLRSDVEVLRGSGTQTDPYVITE